MQFLTYSRHGKFPHAIQKNRSQKLLAKPLQPTWV